MYRMAISVCLIALLWTAGCRLEKSGEKLPLIPTPPEAPKSTVVQPEAPPKPPLGPKVPVPNPKIDFQVAKQHVQQARDFLADQRYDKSTSEMDKALRALSFLEANLPDTLVAQTAEKVNICLKQSDHDAARNELDALSARLKAISSPAPASGLLSGIARIRHKLTAPQPRICSADIEWLVEQATSSDPVALIASARSNLVGAQQDLARRAFKLVEVQLNEAAEDLAVLGDKMGITKPSPPPTAEPSEQPSEEAAPAKPSG